MTRELFCDVILMALASKLLLLTFYLLATPSVTLVLSIAATLQLPLSLVIF